MLVRIVTHCTWTSLGSVLQAFGLKKALQKENIHSQILLPENLNTFRSSKVNSLKSLVRYLFAVIIKGKRQNAFQKRLRFLRENLDLYDYASWEELEHLSQKEDGICYLAGSDQIWNPDLCDPVFFLHFAKGKKRVSYAASMGKTQLSVEQAMRFHTFLEDFDHISVREQACAEVIQKLTDKPVSVHIDPAFLIPAEQWREYETPYPVQGPYILLYMLYWSRACRAEIQALKKQTGLPVYAVCNGLSSVSADRHLYDVGVEEFLWLVDHAAYVVTSSFHGAAFSAIFNKQFSPVVNPKLPSRMDHLLQCLQIPKVEISQLSSAAPLPYERINQRIRAERERSLAYLKRVLRE